MICKCKICEIEFKTVGKLQRIYCSNKCKFADKQYNSNRSHNIKNEKIRLISNIDGWETQDSKNLSGVITRYLLSKNIIFDKETYLTYFTAKDIIDKPKLTCPICQWTTEDLTNKSGVFTTHLKNVHNKTIDEFLQDHSEYKYLWITHLNKKRIQDYINETPDNKIECKICNKFFRKLTNKHLSLHNMTPTTYKSTYNISSTCSTTTTKKQSLDQFERQKEQVFSRISDVGLIPLFSKTEYLGVEHSYNFQCTICKNSFEDNLNDGRDPVCRICNPKLDLFPNKKIENEIFKFLQDLKLPVITNDRKLISPKELDFYIPTKNIAIECNGLYWHSEIYRDKKYHLDKTLTCKDKNVRLIHIFEDEWNNKQDIIKSKLSHIFGLNTNLKLNARNCIITTVSPSDKVAFLNKNHIQGSDNSSHYYGAYHNSILIGIITFSKPRIALGYKNQEDGVFELVRYCSDISVNVRGLFSKLLKHAIKELNPKKIITYADIRFTDSCKNVYIKNGFSFIGTSEPNYFWCKNGKRNHRYNFNKFKLKELGYDVENKTENEIMTENKYYKIWDCGHLKYEMHL